MAHMVAVGQDGKFPGPDAELSFWTRQARDLASLKAQLASEKSMKLGRSLEIARSAYLPSLRRLGRSKQSPIISHVGWNKPASVTDLRISLL